MASSQSKWMTFLDDNLLEDSAQPNAFFWCGLNEQADISVDNSCSRKDADDHSKACSRKRLRDGACGAACNKACREKIRRDRLNDRFQELSSILEPGGSPKIDKIVILSHALRALNELKAEAQQHKDTNDQLRETIKELKAEKNEIRDEKLRLKKMKDELEQQIKTMSMSPGYMPHPVALYSAMAAFAGHSQAPGIKSTSMPEWPGMGMWQWMPPAALDISQDHKLRPPVA